MKYIGEYENRVKDSPRRRGDAEVRKDKAAREREKDILPADNADMKTRRDYRLSPGTSFPYMKPSESPQSASKAGVQVEGSGCFRTGTMGKDGGFNKWDYAERPTIGS